MCRDTTKQGWERGQSSIMCSLRINKVTTWCHNECSSCSGSSPKSLRVHIVCRPSHWRVRCLNTGKESVQHFHCIRAQTRGRTTSVSTGKAWCPRIVHGHGQHGEGQVSSYRSVSCMCHFCGTSHYWFCNLCYVTARALLRLRSKMSLAVISNWSKWTPLWHALGERRTKQRKSRNMKTKPSPRNAEARKVEGSQRERENKNLEGRSTFVALPTRRWNNPTPLWSPIWL